MGIVKEPNGIDFLIESKPLSDKERCEISAFIKASKLKNKKSLSKPNIRQTEKVIS
jgi:hypothetical protein